MKPHRRQPLYLAFLLHRLSGLGLALFLPFHFYVLGLALKGEAELNGFLHWSQAPLVKLAETGLVFLLAVASIMVDVWGKEFTIWAWMSGNWGVVQ